MNRPGEHGDAFSSSRKPNPSESASLTWTAIARFLNAAEAGYFAHELKVLGEFPVKLRAEDDFDAVSGHWSTGFVLSVPTPSAEQATFALQELVSQTEGEAPLPSLADGVGFESDFLDPHGDPYDSQPFDPYPEDREFAEESPFPWGPIIVTLAAGSLAFWSIRTFWKPARPQPAAPVNAPRDVLWDAMRTPHGRKWVQFDAAGRQIRELEINPAGTEATIKEDADGDQIFERSRQVKRP